YKTKAKSLVDLSKMLCQEYDGEVPNSLEELVKLPGIGRKTANLIMGDVFGAPSCVVADTHLIRITNRFGLVSSKDPYQVEISLRKLLPPDESNNFCHRIVHFGREVCTARDPKCEICLCKEICPKVGIK
ncbi:MAG: endonuclease III, partial [Clostridia bacterium]|nr:endonuclease III [Clostridia bacterium]